MGGSEKSPMEVEPEAMLSALSFFSESFMPPAAEISVTDPMGAALSTASPMDDVALRRALLSSFCAEVSAAVVTPDADGVGAGTATEARRVSMEPISEVAVSVLKPFSSSAAAPAMLPTRDAAWLATPMSTATATFSPVELPDCVLLASEAPKMLLSACEAPATDSGEASPRAPLPEMKPNISLAKSSLAPPPPAELPVLATAVIADNVEKVSPPDMTAESEFFKSLSLRPPAGITTVASVKALEMEPKLSLASALPVTVPTSPKRTLENVSPSAQELNTFQDPVPLEIEPCRK
mmetsp:Transcript_54281/g.176428  ORF Transcript_54281/g.176428 Transcript_54281/m.176428 type:complete len:294 (-) Transcript_54281:1715-2596(-)